MPSDRDGAALLAAASAEDIKAAHRAMPNWMEVVARRRLGRGDDWEAFAFSVVRDGDEFTDRIAVSGAVPIGFVARGPSKGLPKYPPAGQCDRVVITQGEVAAERAAWEAATGKCAECAGTGQAWAGWSRDHGTRYRDCAKCQASGKSAASLLGGAR